jgi:hypothetical protein
MQLFKLMEQCFQSKDEFKDPTKVPPAKAVARVLSGVLSRRVAALVMILVISTPLLQYQQIDNAYMAHTNSFGRYMQLSNDTISTEDWNAIAVDFRNFYKEKDMHPINLTVMDGEDVEVFNIDWHNDFGYLREDSKIYLSSDVGNVDVVISLAPQLQQEVRVTRIGAVGAKIDRDDDDDDEENERERTTIPHNPSPSLSATASMNNSHAILSQPLSLVAGPLQHPDHPPCDTGARGVYRILPACGRSTDCDPTRAYDEHAQVVRKQHTQERPAHCSRKRGRGGRGELPL